MAIGFIYLENFNSEDYDESYNCCIILSLEICKEKGNVS